MCVVLRGYTDSSLKCGMYICSNSVNFVVENKGRIPEYVKIIAPKCGSQNLSDMFVTLVVLDKYENVYNMYAVHYILTKCEPLSFFFIQVLYTLQEKEYKGNSHLAKRLILRLPETKPEKEMNTYKFSERDVQAPIEINRT